MKDHINQFSYDSVLTYLYSIALFFIAQLLNILRIEFGSRIPIIHEWNSILSYRYLWKILENSSEEASKIIFGLIQAFKDNFIWILALVGSFIYLIFSADEDFAENIVEKLTEYKFLRNFAFFLLNVYILFKTLRAFNSKLTKKSQYLQIWKNLLKLVNQAENVAVLTLFIGFLAVKNDNYMFQYIGTQAWILVLIVSMLIFNLRRIKSTDCAKKFSIKMATIIGYFLLASLVDPLFYAESTKKHLFWPIRHIGRNLIFYGDILPGLFLTWQIFKKFIQKTNIRYIYPAVFTSYFSSIFGLYAYFILKIYLKYRPDPETHFMSNLPLLALFCQWNILLRTIYQMVMQRKAFSYSRQPPSFRSIYLFVSLTPLIILLGGTGTSKQILCLLMIWAEIYDTESLKIDGSTFKQIELTKTKGFQGIGPFLQLQNKFEVNSMMKNSKYQTWLERSILTQVVARIVFHTSGNRQLISTLCVKCGTLFTDNFHPLSFLIVAIKISYPFIFSLLLSYIMDCQTLEENFKQFRENREATPPSKQKFDENEAVNAEK